MGYQIFSGYHLETLVEAHFSLFQTPFFGPQPLVVLQNQSLAQWLKLLLARRLGGYATGDFLFQDEALRRLLKNTRSAPDKILFLDELKFSLYRHLSVVLTPPFDPVFAPLIGQKTPDPLRVFELSDHIAGVFHNYSMNSALWPSALATGKMPAECAADLPAFAWQSKLWQELLTGSHGTLAGVVMDQLTQNPPVSTAPPPRMVLIGSAFLSRRAAAFLRAWAEAGLVDVVQLLLLPAPPQVHGWPDRRPWSSWGAFGKAFLEAFPPLPETELPPLKSSPTALQTLQDALVRGQSFPKTLPDNTLEIVSAPHPLRELEILRDRLLAALQEDPTLEVHEIAVLAPDIKLYAPFFEAAFCSDDPGRNLHYHVIDLDLGRENSWFRSLDALLSLVSGTIDRPTLFALIDDVDKELWLDYTEIVSAWREESGTSKGPQSWTASWDRLFEGWFQPGFDVAPTAFRSLGRFHQLVSDLRLRNRETHQARSFGLWIRFLDELAATFLPEGDTAAILSGRLRALVQEAGGADVELPWMGFRAFVQDQIAHFPGRKGQLLTEGLHCSSLRPLRAIPFRVIAVLGLDEGQFPRKTPMPSFDLRRFEPDQDRVSALALDRYSFWETLMAAQSRLYLSYHGRSATDGSLRPPSPVLSDLLDYLEENGTPWPVVQASVKDFSVLPDSGPTWSPRTWRRAMALTAPSRIPQEIPRPLQTTEDLFPEVRSNEVIQMFTAPAKFHLRRVRQVGLRDEDSRSVDEEEPWSLSFFDRLGWLQERLRLRLGGHEITETVDQFLKRMTITGRIREGVFAERDRRSLENQTVLVEAWAEELNNLGWSAQQVRAPRRTLWAGLPWATEPDDRLGCGSDILLPRFLWAEKINTRTLVDTALRVLQDPAPQAFLATLNPSGERKNWSWSPDADQTEQLIRQAEQYWREGTLRPLPFYPDYLEALAKRRKDDPQELWPVSVEGAWRSAKKNDFSSSENTLAHCPYAQLAFPDDPDWNLLAADTTRWWDMLFQPLLEAWK